MTNQNPAVLPARLMPLQMPNQPVAPFGSGIDYWGMLTQDQKEEVLNNVKDEAAALFDTYVKTIKEASGLRTPKGNDRLQMYRTRTPEQWDAVYKNNQKAYSEQMQDWGKLEHRDVLTPPSKQQPESPVTGLPMPAFGDAPNLTELQ